MNNKSENTKSFQEKGWLKLDNAAKLFPAIISEDLTSVFRITATLKEPVKYNAVREAVEITARRFPYFNVSLGSGLFWHFLEFHDHLPRLMADEDTPCTAFPIKRRNELLYRVIVKEKCISVEFLHVLTDGGGALEFLKALIYTYFTVSGRKITPGAGIITPEQPVGEEEYEDGYKKFFRKLPPPGKLAKAWQLPYKLNERPRLRVLRADMDSCELIELTHRAKVSVTEYLVAVYLYSLQEIHSLETEKNKKSFKKVLRIEVPVNMRKKYPSRTMRNFSLFVQPELDLRLGSYTFEEVLQSVHHQLQLGTDVKQISRFLSSNVGYEKLFIVRVLPLFIKEIAISSIYRSMSSKRLSGLVTNLGSVTLPAEMCGLVDSFEIIPPPPNPKVKAGLGVVSFNNRLRICISNISVCNDLERIFLRHFTDAGVHIRILNNN
jgi:NRPS condensation-like uncharacterized protein